MPDTADLECRAISKSFDDFQAVKEVSFDVPPGTFFSILGPSGCGKTTLLRMIAGFQAPSGGDLLIKGKSMLNVPPNKRPVSMVFQHLALFPMMSIGANVGFGLRQRGVNKVDIKRQVERVLERVGLGGVADRPVDSLSGGQKQRVAIARCMVLEPDVLLLDEPLGALDLKLREHMKIELKKLQSEFNTTFVYITHDQSEALVMSDQIAVMNHGVFEQVGTARDLYYHPSTAFVAGFVGEANKYQAKVQVAGAGSLQLLTRDGVALQGVDAGEGLKEGEMTQVFVRPEAVRLSRRQEDVANLGNTGNGKVESVLFNGANSQLILRDSATGSEMSVALPQTSEFRDLTKGDPIFFGWEPDQTRCYRQAAG
ncbi:ABC transporter ATP-binding protein [Sulfitobacter mediterraneus]|jgi:spermidine/putrescine transport system ATP-binding protein|uniref:ABC transporter ATP-binding protein n=1 Tax=Sulfitobacter mediterraneus TaxID=83219 RepID=UPI001932F699|nr:ABC transporter ATP-binding protein [Sulfitobacter mediterraneus]MBM1633602.1 ABC transporter ATP-binding protein [Sulfitobacter mediterraneus]MBM1641883.1 ABC transporter ATP-binding protein [Sulfitobacter mediterraneus]MBM1645466.1 ABC transporter ATP-binding protein [Sulfitobacter mediterraneus]MBM1650002.1 ABC transporter ATP-binding protein [Sulfitobacter mediterraneus]MBM1653535.1 ABC transporter ATP-binding protein [Sulfitobacter mediterraneus]